MSTDIWTPEITAFAGLPFSKPSEVRASKGVCLAIYGPSNAGKTTLAETIKNAKGASPVLFVDAEGGSGVLPDDERVQVVSPASWGDLIKIKNDASKAPKLDFSSIVFDNLSEMMAMNLRSIVAPGEPPQIQDYGKSTAQLLDFVRTFRNLSRSRGLNVVFVMWDQPVTNEDGREVGQTLALTPSFSRSFRGILDHIGRLSVENNPPKYTRKLSFAPHPRFANKMRVAPGDAMSKIPFDIYNPDLGAIVDTAVHGKPWPADRFKLSQPVSAQAPTQSNSVAGAAQAEAK